MNRAVIIVVALLVLALGALAFALGTLNGLAAALPFLEIEIEDEDEPGEK